MGGPRQALDDAAPEARQRSGPREGLTEAEAGHAEPVAVVLGTLLDETHLAFEIDCMQPIVYNQTAVLQSNCLDLPERESQEFGWQAGLAVRYWMLVLDARYARALSSVLAEGDLINQGLLVTLGVRF